MTKGMNKTIVITVMVAVVVSAVVAGIMDSGQPSVVERVIERLGSAGQEMVSPIAIDGDKIYAYSQRINTASSTGACKFYSPAATTTMPLDGLRVNADAATGTMSWYANYFAGDIEPAQYATTSGLLGQSMYVAANVAISPVLVASATPAAIGGDRSVAPNSLIVVGFSGIVNSGNTRPWGNCFLRLHGTE